MSYDPSVPLKLKTTQQWFGGVISQPIDENSLINPIAPSGNAIETEAPLYISPGPKLLSHQRIQIYNQQYWWRLLTVMQENFPLVTRLFGYHDFNQTLAMPYLVKYPPHHWTLNDLGDRFADWVEEEYHATDKELVLFSAQIDWAYTFSFVCEEAPKISQSEIDSSTLYLQPHLFCFVLPYDLFQFRRQFLLKDPDYWVENDFPKLEHYPEGENGCFVLYRNQINDILTERISFEEMTLLKQLQAGRRLDDICAWLEEQPQESQLYKAASAELGLWFQRWAKLNWLTTKAEG